MRRFGVLSSLVVVALIGCTEREAVAPMEFEASFARASGASGASGAAGAVGQNLGTHMTGDEEVPVRETRAQGQAHFQLNRAGTEISYWMNVANIENVTMAHIHVAPAGVNGPPVVWLYPNTSPPALAAGGGRIQGRVATGSFTAADLVGPLAGQSLSALLEVMRAGNTYVNVHTRLSDDEEDPVNTGPGNFPGGEIRGQIRVLGPRF
jgi:hypothetical protein